MIRLSSILGVLNTTNIFKDIPSIFHSTDGDFMTLLNVMNRILLIQLSVRSDQFDLKVICQELDLTKIQHILAQALKRHKTTSEYLDGLPEFRTQSKIHSNRWKSIAKALLTAYPENVFVSMKELQERIHRYERYIGSHDIATMDLQSTLVRPKTQASVPMILAKDVRFASYVRDLGVLSFVGQIQATWLDQELERQLLLTKDEETELQSKNIFTRLRSLWKSIVSSTNSNQKMLTLKQQASIVFHEECDIRSKMIVKKNFKLENPFQSGTAEHKNLARNLNSLTKMVYVFQPMCWRWKNQRQVEITVNQDHSTHTCEVIVEGRLSEYERVRNEFKSFETWLKRCAVLRHPKSGKFIYFSKKKPNESNR